AGAAFALGLGQIAIARLGAPPTAAAVALTPPPPPPSPAWDPPPARPPPALAATLAVKPRPRLATASGCEPTESWKRGIREQLEDLEKLSLAKMKDDAAPSEVAKVRQRARGIATSLRNAQGTQCQRVEADLRAWRMALR
ncbi:MAG: hypothetical protein H6Q89_692, partial [Myxococcaceae bacterium]|nr:hypothetical protein [Myxococcaceae bacterium]